MHFTRQCAYCFQDKPWEFRGKKMKDGTKVYVDDRGVRWAGRRCPECERERVHHSLRFDPFERHLVLTKLADEGCTVISHTLPIKAEKAGQVFEVEVLHATTLDGRIVVDKPPGSTDKLLVLVFQSTRILSADQISRLSYSVSAPAEPLVL